MTPIQTVQIPESGQQNVPALEEREGGVFPVPANIRPVLSTYRLEVCRLL